MTKKILLIAVSYNCPIETVSFVESISQLINCELIQMVIVENSEFSNRNAKLSYDCKKFIDDIIYVETDFNRNYFGSVNYALAKASLNPCDFVYFVISNVDIKIPDVLFIDKLLSFNLLNVGIIAPKIFSTSRAIDQNPYLIKRFKKILFYYYFIIRQHVYLTNMHETVTDFFRNRNKSNVIKVNKERVIYAPHGAFIIFTNEYFKRKANIDFGLNLFGEEIFVAEECRKNNLIVYYQPNIEVWHTEHISTGVVSSAYVVNKKRQSVIYFLKNFK